MRFLMVSNIGVGSWGTFWDIRLKVTLACETGCTRRQVFRERADLCRKLIECRHPQRWKSRWKTNRVARSWAHRDTNKRDRWNQKSQKAHQACVKTWPWLDMWTLRSPHLNLRIASTVRVRRGPNGDTKIPQQAQLPKYRSTSTIEWEEPWFPGSDFPQETNPLSHLVICTIPITIVTISIHFHWIPLLVSLNPMTNLTKSHY